MNDPKERRARRRAQAIIEKFDREGGVLIHYVMPAGPNGREVTAIIANSRRIYPDISPPDPELENLGLEEEEEDSEKNND